MSGAAATRGSSFAAPYACAYASWPCVTTATVALGTPVLERTAEAIESTRADSAAVPLPCARACADSTRRTVASEQERIRLRSVMVLDGE